VVAVGRPPSAGQRSHLQQRYDAFRRINNREERGVWRVTLRKGRRPSVVAVGRPPSAGQRSHLQQLQQTNTHDAFRRKHAREER
jgi:hypothetical protein